MGRKTKRPLNSAAVAAADDQFYAAHPEMAPNGQRRPISSNDPASMRSEWMDYYVANGGELEGDPPRSAPPPITPTTPVQPCPCKGTLSVQVIDDAGLPIEGAVVEVSGVGASFTNVQGIAEFPEIDPQTYTVTAEKERTSSGAGEVAGSATDTVFVPENQTTSLVLIISAQNLVINLTCDDTPNNKIIMNNPDHKVLVTAYVDFVNRADLPTTVTFSFVDPASDNTQKVNSHDYVTGSKFLGKRDDATAIFWEAHPDSNGTSDDGFKLTAKAELNVVSGTSAEAKIWFKPAGVGGDNYKIKGAISDGPFRGLSDESNTLIVWRKISLQPWEMSGQTHVSTHGTAGKMATYYTADTFVEYALGTINAVPASSTATYIGLWDHGTTSELNWATHSAKLLAETPTATETTDANGPAGPTQVTARAAIQTKANAWRDRLISAYNSGIGNWASDAGIPINTLIAIEHEHPKYSAASPDSTTTEWTTFPWLRITVEGRSIHPDARWINGQGLSSGNRAYITAGMTAARTEVVIAHEAGHETKNQFKRAPFGAGDHSPVAGMMDTVGSLSAFTAREKELLKGVK